MSKRRLGKRPDGFDRIKASPDLFPNEGPCDITEAYDQLSRNAFAVWIRLSVAEQEELRSGRTNLAERIGYSTRQCNEVLRELDRKGFITFLPEGPWRRTTIVVTRKPLLQRGHGFVRFS